MIKRFIVLANDLAKQAACRAIKEAPIGWVVKISETNRTLEQNADQWPYLEAFAKQLQWPVNGKLEWLTADEWKDILTAAFKAETVRIAQGMDGGMVMLGKRTSKFNKKEFSEWLEFLHATAALRGVVPEYKNSKECA